MCWSSLVVTIIVTYQISKQTFLVNFWKNFSLKASPEVERVQARTARQRRYVRHSGAAREVERVNRAVALELVKEHGHLERGRARGRTREGGGSEARRARAGETFSGKRAFSLGGVRSLPRSARRSVASVLYRTSSVRSA